LSEFMAYFLLAFSLLIIWFANFDNSKLITIQDLWAYFLLQVWLHGCVM